MSVDALELIVIILAGVVVVSAVYEFARYWLKRIEDKREQERVDHWRRKRMP